MPEVLLFIIVIAVVGVAVVYGATKIPTPWSWLLIGIYVIIVLAWFGKILGMW